MIEISFQHGEYVFSEGRGHERISVIIVNMNKEIPSENRNNGEVSIEFSATIELSSNATLGKYMTMIAVTTSTVLRDLDGQGPLINDVYKGLVSFLDPQKTRQTWTPLTVPHYLPQHTFVCLIFFSK